MLRKLVWWVIVFIISLCGWEGIDQGTVFWRIYFIGKGLTIIVNFIIGLKEAEIFGEKFVFIIDIIIEAFINLFVIVFVSSIASEVYGIEFTTVYQIITLGQCLARKTMVDYTENFTKNIIKIITKY